MDQRPLLDLPPAWLASVVLGVAESRQLNPLFRTCSKLQQLIFHQPAILPVLHVYSRAVEELGEHLHARALAMAEAAEAKLRLILEVMVAQGQALDQLLASAAALIPTAQQPQEPPAVFQLTCITVVSISGQLNGAPLDCILPDTLVQHCPNLQQLKLNRVRVDHQYSTPQLTCNSFQKLVLRNVLGIESAGCRQHLLDLPSLTDLNLPETGAQGDYEEGGMFWAAIARYSTQLRRLHGFPRRGMRALPWSPTTQLPVLQQLELDLALDCDNAVQQLLTTAPNLKRVKLLTITGLKRSFAQVQCSWQELRLRDVHMAELAKLPLSNCTRLMCTHRLDMRNRDEGAPTQEQITAAVAALQMTGGLHLGNHVGITLYADDVERLTAAAPLLRHIGCRACLRVQDAPWTECRHLLAVLGQHLRCEQVFFGLYGWSGNPGALAQLPELLPHVTVFQFYVTPPEAELVEMVRTGSRPFTLILFNDVLRAQLQQVMQETGHQLVTIE